MQSTSNKRQFTRLTDILAERNRRPSNGEVGFPKRREKRKKRGENSVKKRGHEEKRREENKKKKKTVRKEADKRGGS